MTCDRLVYIPTCFNMATEGKFDELDLSKDEIERLTKALKNEEFRKLFAEYAEEISDPENKARYEAEIAQMEREKGMDVQFVHPQPGHVVKTTINGDTKAFINICKNEHVGKPTSKKQTGSDGRSGLSWSIPHSFAPPREDMDKSGKKCKTIDFVVHPDTYRMAESNVRFKKMLHDTAFDGIERQFEFKCDRKNVKFPKMKFKGVATPTVIRTRKEDKPSVKKDDDDILSKFPDPYGQETTEEKMKKREEEINKREDKKAQEKESVKAEEAEVYTEPKYIIKHRSELDFQNYRNARDANPSTRPKELVVEVELPLLKSAASVNLDIFESKLVLTTEKPAKYKLDISLPYAVDENEGSAKFDKSKRKLNITLPVIPSPVPALNGDATINGVENVKTENNDDENDGLQCKNTTEPLIEVLHSEDNSQDSISNISQEYTSNKTEKQQTMEPALMPEIDYFQHDETVTIILKVANVIKTSLKSSFTASGCSIRITSVGSGGFPMDFSFCCQFEDDSIEADNSRVEMSSENIVVVFVKTDEHLGAWDKFMAGSCSDKLEEQFFLTTRNLCKRLDQLDDAIKEESDSDKPTLNVTAMDSDKLEILVKKPGNESDSSVSPTMESVEVYHKTDAPPLHSILKHRSHTMSESSDDLSKSYPRQNSCPTGPSEESSLIDSEDDDSDTGHCHERKKSVSFSEDIDTTLYKSMASVNTLKASIKSKKKNQRKRDRKEHDREVRRRSRQNSGSYSEPSSDDQLHGNETSSKAKGKKATTNTTKSSSSKCENGGKKTTNDVANPTDSGDHETRETKIEDHSSEEHSEELEAATQVLSDGVFHDSGRCATVADEAEVIQDDIDISSSAKNEDDIAPPSSTKDDSDISPALSTKDDSEIAPDLSTKANIDPASTKDEDDIDPAAAIDEDDIDPASTKDRDDIDPASTLDEDDIDPASTIDEDDIDPVSSAKPPFDEYTPKTMLSWDEKSPVYDPMIHGPKPSSAVDLTNSVMFDLDVD